VVTRGRFRIVVNLAADETVVPVDGAPADQVMAFGTADPVTDGIRLSGHGVALFVV
jgi:maltooligosyltrehalose trehalohydrolase